MATTFITLVNDALRRLNEVELTSTDFATATGFRALVKDAVNASLQEISQKEFDANKKLLVSLVSGIVLVLKEKPFFMNDEFTLVDCYMTAILYRLPYLGVSIPNSKSFSSLKAYQEKLFKRPSFDLSLTDSERDLKYSF